ncbi:MAG: hypothetical protein L6R37_001069 [Teloschistes peruensis]|nr:MAG: hypothetical protein L6R37_001069 [Teloschistes peruensis]
METPKEIIGRPWDDEELHYELIRREFDKFNPGKLKSYTLKFERMGGQDMQRVIFNKDEGWEFTVVAERKDMCLTNPQWGIDWPHAAEGSSAAEGTQPADASADTTTAATGAPVDTDNLRDLLSEGAAGTNKIPDFMDCVKDPKQLIDELLRAEKAGEEPNLANIELLDETEKGTKNDSRWTGLSVDHEFLSFLKSAYATSKGPDEERAAQGGAPGVLG